MNVATSTYDRLIGAKGVKKVWWHAVRKCLVKLLGDPPCTFMIHGRTMQLPLSHALPKYLTKYPLYDSLPRRIGNFVRKRRGALACIDVGANVGDTVAAFGADDPGSTFLAIEPNPKFGSFLKANWQDHPNVKILRLLCSSTSTIGKGYRIKEHAGTASVVQDDRAGAIETASIDDIVFSSPGFREVNVIKIDTDGHDFEVLAGAVGTITSFRPVVLFECDAFANSRYVDDCITALARFRSAGYREFFIYDNFGYLIGRHSLDDIGHFRQLLFYQMTNAYLYFDLLLMPPEDAGDFHEEENRFFLENLVDDALRQPARAAAV